MHKFAVAAVALAAAGAVNADYESGGNWYGESVKGIQFSNFGGSGSYNKVTNMNSDGSCSHAPQAYSGSLAPLNEEVSLHFRGPLQLKQLAFYSPNSNNNILDKRTVERRSSQMKRHNHGHAHLHKRHDEVEQEAKRDVLCDMANAWVTVVDKWGKTESWKNDYDPAGCLSTAAAAPTSTANAIGQVQNNAAAVITAAAAAVTGKASAKTQSASTPSGTGDWVQNAYYDAETSQSSGFTFLSHNGGQGSGVWDTAFGNSLSYTTSNVNGGSSSPQVLADTTIPAGEELVIMTDKSCSDGSCDYYRPGSVAYHGFNGSSKVFLMEFGMPSSSDASNDMPAVWMLNAQIPRTQQYGSCSCWNSGCGEFDLFEVLDNGDTKCKATVHGNSAGGPAAYFARPVTGTVKAAVTMTGEQAVIMLLNDNYVFPSSLSNDDVQNFVGSAVSSGSLSSLSTLFTDLINLPVTNFALPAMGSFGR